jgi:hypothetical protein
MKTDLSHTLPALLFFAHTINTIKKENERSTRSVPTTTARESTASTGRSYNG